MAPLAARPAARLLPATEATEDETAYYRARLEDPALLDAGAVVLVASMRLLAVPVGGRRRGGFIPTDTVAVGLAVRAALTGRPGFPNVRFRWSTDLEVCHHVAWGPRPPEWDDGARGRFYGYRADAIARYLARPVAPRWLESDSCPND